MLDDECFLISDIKDQKIIVFDRTGKYLLSWKTLGQGPGEYQGMWLTDFQKPYLRVYDLRARKLLLYQRIGPKEFQWTRDIHNREGIVFDFKIDDRMVFFDNLVYSRGIPYFIHIVDLDGKNDKYCLPAALRYGLKPEADWKRPHGAYSMLWGSPGPFLDVLEEHIYSAWKGMLQVIKVDKATKKWTIFGHKTKNYSQPKIWDLTPGELKKATQLRKENEYNFSFVAGIFTDKTFVGLLYLNYDKEISAWVPILQIYNEEGIFLKETRLSDAQPVDKSLKHYYCRETGCLYVLNMNELDSGETEFEILRYQLRE